MDPLHARPTVTESTERHSRYALTSAQATALLAALTLGAQLLGENLVFNHSGTPISVLWPPNGIAIALLLLAPLGHWPRLLIGFAVAKLALEPALLNGLVQVSLDSFEIAFVAGFVRWRRPYFALDSVIELLTLYGAIALGVLLSSQAAALSLWLSDHSLDYWNIVQTWAFSDALGSALLVPTILLTHGTARQRYRVSRRQSIELLLLLVTFGTALSLLMRSSVTEADIFVEMPYVMFPLLGLAAFRFGRTVTLVLLCITAFSLATQLTILHNGPFYAAVAPPAAVVASLQTFLAALTLSICLLAFLLHERSTQQRRLADAAWQYELLVEGQPDFIVRITHDGLLKFANQSCGHYFRFDPQAALDTHWGNYLPPRARTRCFAAARALSVTKPEFNAAYHMTHQGETRWHEWHGRGYFDDNGGLLEFVAVGSDVTGRVLADRKARASDEKFVTAFQSSPTAIDIVRTRDGLIVDVNSAWEELFEYTRAEAVGSTSLELALWVTLNDRTELLRQIRETGQAQLALSQQRAKSGRIKPCYLASRPLRLNGELHLLTNHVDMSARVAMEEAIRVSEERFSKAFRSSPTAMAIAHADDGIIVEVNHALCVASGFGRDELLGKRALDLGMWESTAARQRFARGIYKEKRFGPEETLFRRRDGSLITTVTSAELITLGGAPHIILNLLDITERVKAEQALRLSQEKIESIFNASPAAITLYDLDSGRLLEVNDAVVSMLNYPREYILERNVQDFVRWPDLAARNRYVIALRRNGAVKNVEAKLESRSGRFVEAIGSAETLQIEGRSCVLAAFIDITEHNALFDQLRQSQKMEAMGRLASGIAHDFNNIVTAVRGYAEMLIEFSDLPPKDLEYATEIERAAHRAGDLIGQLMMFARREDSNASIVDAGVVISDMHGMLDTAMDSNVQLKIQLPTTPATVRIARSGLEQVVLNLVINADDAIDVNGEVCIEVECREATAQVQIRVRDNGIGIAPGHREKIFEPFFTTKPIGEGTGLGLPIVYGIVERAGGHIKVDSEVGKGTCFEVTLPWVREAADTVLADPRTGVMASTERFCLIVAEDDDSVRAFAVSTLQRAGHAVLAARHGGEALALLDKRADIDAVLSDIDMPSVGGFQLQAVIRARYPRVPVFLMTGKLDGLGDERNNVLIKPFSAGALCEYVARRFTEWRASNAATQSSGSNHHD